MATKPSTTQSENAALKRRLENSERALSRAESDVVLWRKESARFKDKWVEECRLAAYWEGMYKSCRKPLVRVALGVAWSALAVALVAVLTVLIRF